MTSTKYLIRLKPVGKYFFGGERTFGSDNTNYLVRSRYFPQQTALLGLLRYQILKEKGWLSSANKPVPPEAAGFIGKHSFKLNNNAANAFGKIDSLSHLFLLKNEKERYEIAPRDCCIRNIYDDKKTDTPVHFKLKNDNGVMPLFEQDDKANDTLGFSPKDYHTENITEGTTLIPFENRKDSPFIEHHQVGILKRQNQAPKDNRNEDKTADEKGFYKQYFYTLHDAYEFAFVAELNEDILTENKGTIVNFGGQRSRFRMTIQKVNQAPKAVEFKNENPDYAKIMLLSDAYISPEIYDDCVLALTETQEFRCIVSSVTATTDYNNVPRENNASENNNISSNKEVKKQDKTKLRKSAKLNLLKKGSVFYCEKDKANAVINELKKYEDFRQIGYNQFIQT